MLSITVVAIISSTLLLFMSNTADAGCECDKWCRDRGNKRGKCGDGHTCLCSNGPHENMKNGQSADGCGCNKWCRDWNNLSGICGDSDTCICGQQKPTFSAPAETWKEHWFDYNALLKRVYYDDEMDKSTISWTSKFTGDVWRYVKRTYGSFGSDGRLYAIYHKKAIGGRPGYYYSASHDHKNVIDCGQGPMLEQSRNTDMVIHEIFHIVESASFNSEGSPGFGTPPNGIWGDSKMAEIFIYDVYRGLGLNKEVERFKNSVIGRADSWPKPKTYIGFATGSYHGGETKTLVNFFRLLSQHFPKNNGTKRYSRQMNWGEFIHFSNGAARANMKDQATKAFGWTNEMEEQFQKARKDFPRIQY